MNEETYTVYCPECGMDYPIDHDLKDDTVYVCGHCGSELVAGGINGLLPYWGEFWDENTGDNAPRVKLERKRSGYYADSLRAMFTESMEAVAKISIRPHGKQLTQSSTCTALTLYDRG